MSQHEPHPNPNPHDDPSPFPLAMSVVFGALITIASVLAIKGLDDSHTAALRQERWALSAESSLARTLADQQRGDLNTAAWLDKQQGAVRVPIDRAIAITASEWASGSGPASRPSGSAAASRPAGG